MWATPKIRPSDLLVASLAVLPAFGLTACGPRVPKEESRTVAHRLRAKRISFMALKIKGYE